MKELPVTPGRRVMCPENCRYRSKLAPFCGYCLPEVMKKLERERKEKKDGNREEDRPGQGEDKDS